MPSASNVTKFLAGGSGDNYIADGFIRTVEKIWMDSYTFAFTGTNSTIDIAIIPNNKKITGIDVIIDSTISQSNGTVSIGFSTDASVATFLAPTTISHNLTKTGISLPFMGLIQSYASATLTNATQVLAAFGTTAGYQLITAGTQTTISVKLNNWTMTSGSLKAVVKYT